MKAPAFWYQPAGHAAKILAPLASLYQHAAKLRRHFAKPYQAGVPVICVGNVVAGGAGKTPTALALAALLQEQGHKPVFVTRGYGGSQRGPLQVDADHHTAADVGDEALLLLRQAPVWIGRDRAAAIRQAEKFATHIILDDGLQNPHIKPTLSLLVMDGAVGLGNGQIIPAGPLREAFSEALARSHAVLVIGSDKTGIVPLPFLREGLGAGMVVTHPSRTLNIPNQPSLDPSRKSGQETLAATLAHHEIPLLRAHLTPAIPADFPRSAQFLAFAGIGRPEKFYALCRKEGLTLEATQDFPDHHVFREKELDALEKRANRMGAKLLTTEKDFARLPFYFQKRVSTFPIKLVFEDTAAVEKLISSGTYRG